VGFGVAGASVVGEFVGFEVAGARVIGDFVALIVGDMVGVNVGQYEEEASKEKVKSAKPHVPPIFFETTTEPTSSISDNVALDRRQRQPLGSVLSLHQRFLMFTESIECGFNKSTSHQALPSSVCENDNKSPSIALDGLKLPKVDD